MKTSHAALLVLGALGTLKADVVFQQPSVWNGNGEQVGDGFTDEESTAMTGFQTYDNFSLGSGGTINQVSWVGLYINGSIFLNEPPNTTSWDIDIYANNSGSPGSLRSDTSLTTAQVTSQTLGTGIFGGVTFTMFEFTAGIPAFDAAPGTTYWFSPFSHNPDESAKFIWVQGTGGDGSSFQNRLTLGTASGAGLVGGDRAFSLSDVPEPSAILLLGTVIALAIFMQKRTYKRS